jgi:hypothetical protein
MRRHASPRRLGIAAAVLVTLVVAAGVAGAASGPTVSLTLGGTHAKAMRKCGDAHADPYLAVARGVPFNLVGSVTPAPKKTVWKVRVVVKRCANGHYTRVWTGQAPGRKGGVFRLAYTPKTAGLFIAVADYGRRPNVSSRKVRLHVG